MGVVHAAFDTAMGRSVAIKFVWSGSLDDSARRRFRREGELLARVEHPSVARIYEMGVESGVLPYYVVQRIEGKSLESVASPDSDPEAVRRWGLDILAGLTACHRRGIVHRDVKLSNVLLDEEGRAVLIDFGVAWDRIAPETLTGKEGFVGTLAYMAPEQTERDREAIGSWTDLYAVGATLYHVLSGRPPFEGATEAVLLRQILMRDPRPLAEVRPGLDPRLVEVVARAMVKDPDRRYRSAEEMAAALRFRPRGRPGALRGRAAMAAGAGALLLLAIVASLAGLSEAPPPAEPPEEKPPAPALPAERPEPAASGAPDSAPPSPEELAAGPRAVLDRAIRVAPLAAALRDGRIPSLLEARRRAEGMPIDVAQLREKIDAALDAAFAELARSAFDALGRGELATAEARLRAALAGEDAAKFLERALGEVSALDDRLEDERLAMWECLLGGDLAGARAAWHADERPRSLLGFAYPIEGEFAAIDRMTAATEPFFALLAARDFDVADLAAKRSADPWRAYWAMLARAAAPEPEPDPLRGAFEAVRQDLASGRRDAAAAALLELRRRHGADRLGEEALDLWLEASTVEVEPGYFLSAAEKTRPGQEIALRYQPFDGGPDWRPAGGSWTRFDKAVSGASPRWVLNGRWSALQVETQMNLHEGQTDGSVRIAFEGETRIRFVEIDRGAALGWLGKRKEMVAERRPREDRSLRPRRAHDQGLHTRTRGGPGAPVPRWRTGGYGRGASRALR